MPLSSAELVYIVIVLAAGSYALVRTLLLLRASQRARIKSVEKRRRFEAVRTDTPVDDPAALAVERGVEGIERHSSVLRRLLVPLIVGATLLLAAPPLLAGTPATTASMIGAVIAIILGFALRPFLENAAAGLVISSSQLVRIGDTVTVDDLYGTIEDITATHTAVKVWDWRRYLVPNGRMMQSAFLNHSLFDSYRWAYVEFWVAPDADFDEVAEIAVRAPKQSRHFAPHEEPKFWIMRIDRDAVCCWVAAWTDSPSDAWILSHDVRTALLRELRRRGIPMSLQRHRLVSEGDGAPGVPGAGGGE